MILPDVEFDLGDEFDGHADRLRAQVGLDEKAQFELLDCDVASRRALIDRATRRGSKSPSAISISRATSARLFSSIVRQERSGKPKFRMELRTSERLDRSIGRAEVRRVEQIEQIGRHLASQAGFRNRAARRHAPRRDDALARFVAQVEPLLGVALLVRGAKRVHQRRREAVVSLVAMLWIGLWENARDRRDPEDALDKTARRIVAPQRSASSRTKPTSLDRR